MWIYGKDRLEPVDLRMPNLRRGQARHRTTGEVRNIYGDAYTFWLPGPDWQRINVLAPDHWISGPSAKKGIEQ